jgi:hypothetical protein
MYISLFVLVAIILVSALVGWFARGYMQRAKPAELQRWDDAGNNAASTASAEAKTAADRVRDQLKS